MLTRPLVRAGLVRRSPSLPSVSPARLAFHSCPPARLSLPQRAEPAHTTKGATSVGWDNAASSSGRGRVEQQEEVVEEEVEEVLEEGEGEEKGMLYADVRESLNKHLYAAITERPFKYTTMTPVQAAVLSLLPSLASSPSSPSSSPSSSSPSSPDPITATQDLLVRAKTGTGKTLAFLIPALEGRLRALSAFLASYRLENPEASASQARKAVEQFACGSVGALIISPTRELATQIANEARALATHLPSTNVRLFVGGESKSRQIREFTRAGMANDIVVATPGRMLDLLASEGVVRRQVAGARMLVLDEADTLLDMGFSREIDEIAAHLPGVGERQTFLFSATVSPSIRSISRKMMSPSHLFIDTVGTEAVSTHEHIPQFYTVLPSPSAQISHIANLLAQDQLLHPGGGGKTVLFLPTTRLTQLFSLLLSALTPHLPFGRAGTQVLEIHSKKDQSARSRASALFRGSKHPYSILVTSDVSARGVDYPGVTRVIQVGIPGSKDLYVHRVGRTGRAGKQGRGDLVVMEFEKGFVKSELGGIGLKRVEVGDVEADVRALAEKWDKDPPSVTLPPPTSSFGSSKRRPPTPSSSPASPALPRLSTLPVALSESLLPSLDPTSISETFASLLGYYLPKTSEMRSSSSGEVVRALKEWSTKGWGLESEPFVSESFLRKMGAFKDDGGSRRGGGGKSFGGRERGGRSFGGDRDRGYGGDRERSFGGDRDAGRREWADRPQRRERDTEEWSPEKKRAFREQRDAASGPKGSSFGREARDSFKAAFAGERERESRGGPGVGRGGRDGGREREVRPSFGYSGRSSVYGGGDKAGLRREDEADSWERPQSRGRRAY